MAPKSATPAAKPKRPPENRLRELRELSKLTMAEVATLVGCDESTVHCHETRKKSITSDAATRYAKVFKVPTHELFVALPAS